MRRVILLVFLCLLPMVGGRGFAQSNATTEPESFRVRVENYALGKIEVSTDGGKTYRLIGRVVRPASKPMVDKSASRVGVVLRNTKEFFTFSVGLGQSLIISPLSPSTRTTKPKGGSTPNLPKQSTIVTNLPKTHPFFGELSAPPLTLVRLALGQDLEGDIPDNFALSDENMFVFSVHLPSGVGGTTEDLQQRWKILSEAYQAGAVARAKANHVTVAKDMLTLQPKLPEGEPEPIVGVTYLLDGVPIAAQYKLPSYSFDWDTRQVPNGEYLIEIRGQGDGTKVITRARVLVVVQNP